MIKNNSNQTVVRTSVAERRSNQSNAINTATRRQLQCANSESKTPTQTT